MLQKLRNYKNSPEYQNYLKRDVLSKQIQDITIQMSSVSPDYPRILGLAESIRELHKTKQDLELRLADNERQLQAHSEAYKQVSDARTENGILSEFYKSALESLTVEYLDSLSKTLTEVYQTVYEIQNKEIVLTMEEYRGKKVIRLNVVNHLPTGVFKENLGNDGGSAQIILGTIVSIYFSLMTGGPRLLFLDETLSALDTPILHRFLSILKRFAEELEFSFVIIEHAAFRMKDYVDNILTVEDGVYRVVPLEEWPSLFERTASGGLNG